MSANTPSYLSGRTPALPLIAALATVALLCTAPLARAQSAEDTQQATAKNATAQQEQWELRVCGDPNNLPFSNRKGEGFENRIAELIAEDLGAKLTYFWHPQRRGLIRRTLREGDCDLIIGVPSNYELVAGTAPYYRSGFVFAQREEDARDLRSLQDPALADMRIGVHLQESEGSNPPAQILAQRGLTLNMKGYSVYGDYDEANPLLGIVGAVADGEIDVAVVWGPAAGYFAQRQDAPITMTSVVPPEDRAPPEKAAEEDEAGGDEGGPPGRDDDDDDEISVSPLVFSISMGMRRGDTALQHALDRALARQWDAIQDVLREYGVPLLPLSKPTVAQSTTAPSTQGK